IKDWLDQLSITCCDTRCHRITNACAQPANRREHWEGPPTEPTQDINASTGPDKAPREDAADEKGRQRPKKRIGVKRNVLPCCSEVDEMREREPRNPGLSKVEST